MKIKKWKKKTVAKTAVINKEWSIICSWCNTQSLNFYLNNNLHWILYFVYTLYFYVRVSLANIPYFVHYFLFLLISFLKQHAQKFLVWRFYYGDKTKKKRFMYLYSIWSARMKTWYFFLSFIFHIKNCLLCGQYCCASYKYRE